MTLSDIQLAIGKLDTNQVFALADWLDEYKNDRWDEQMEADAKAGKFDKIIAEVDEEIRKGLTTPL